MHDSNTREKALSMVILAGGRSSRMGTDKSDLLLHGTSFLECQIEKGRRLGIRDILISGYGGNRCSAPVVQDRMPGKGPLGGLEACFRRAEHSRILVLGVDVPLVPLFELERLAGERSDKWAMILKHGDKEEPLIGIYSRDLADEMLEEISARKGSVFAFLNRIGYDTYSSSLSDDFFANINCPADYENCIKG